MGTQIVPAPVPSLVSVSPKRFEVIPTLVDRAVAPRCHDEADELARSLHAVIALLDGHRY
jgi:hypothetical protein